MNAEFANLKMVEQKETQKKILTYDMKQKYVKMMKKCWKYETRSNLVDKNILELTF